MYVIGEAGLIDLILAAGFTWEEEVPDYVVVGLDNYLTYEKVVKATLAIQKGLLSLERIRIRISLQNEVFFLEQGQSSLSSRQQPKLHQFISENQKQSLWIKPLKY